MNFTFSNLILLATINWVVLMAVSVVICKFPRRLPAKPYFLRNSPVRSLGGWSPRIPPKTKYSNFSLSSGTRSVSARGSRRHTLETSSITFITSSVVHWSPASRSFKGMSCSVVPTGNEVRIRFSFPISDNTHKYSRITHSVKPCSMCSMMYFIVSRVDCGKRRNS
ncbi:unnamed protein product [Kuraishia capsulata CBS 1993]|uniref:Uncharacterized protein n=1 Tax=Kuraishia capsulata CBS 1993 TaxID=1382522 RepID=W6MGE2_9ASCO|nr:uncharacterized protein KUCA_T00000828001 [Kuraishia capsulata CBS 1993]CDK24861.1 unnamed protein product [Kuraishia capsulata CBS 1993]